MTTNQISYAKYVEDRRHNMATEQLTAESNEIAKFSKETERAHYERSDMITQQHSERQDAINQEHYARMDAETARSNAVVEGIKQQEADTQQLRTIVDFYLGSDSNKIKSQEVKVKDKEVEYDYILGLKNVEVNEERLANERTKVQYDYEIGLLNATAQAQQAKAALSNAKANLKTAKANLIKAKSAAALVPFQIEESKTSAYKNVKSGQLAGEQKETERSKQSQLSAQTLDYLGSSTLRGAQTEYYHAETELKKAEEQVAKANANKLQYQARVEHVNADYAETDKWMNYISTAVNDVARVIRSFIPFTSNTEVNNGTK